MVQLGPPESPVIGGCMTCEIAFYHLYQLGPPESSVIGGKEYAWTGTTRTGVAGYHERERIGVALRGAGNLKQSTTLGFHGRARPAASPVPAGVPAMECKIDVAGYCVDEEGAGRRAAREHDVAGSPGEAAGIQRAGHTGLVWLTVGGINLAYSG